MTIGLALLGYLLGSIPFSYLIPQWVTGIDIRTVGSGNVGSHNAMLRAGRIPGIAAGILDAGKGTTAVLIARYLDPSLAVAVLAGGAAVIGHNYPIWLGFRGGRGLATSLGVILAVLPGEALIGIGTFGVLWLLVTHNVAFSALIGLLLVAGLAWTREQPSALVMAPLLLLVIMSVRQVPELWTMWAEADDKRDLILNKWIFDRDAEI